MITLEQMKHEVGDTVFNQWMKDAQREIAQQPSLWGHAEVRHAHEYSYMIRQYREYKDEYERTLRITPYCQGGLFE